MKKYLLFNALFILLIGICEGQTENSNYVKNVGRSFPDSIRVEIPEAQGFVVFELKEYTKDHSAINDFDSLLSEVLTFIQKSSVSSDFAVTPHKAKVVYKSKNEKEIHISSDAIKTTKLSIQNNQITELLPPGWEITIHKNNCQIYIYGKNLQSIEKMSKVDFTLVSTKINSQLPTSLRRKSIKSRIILNNGVVAQSDIDFDHPGDIFEVQPLFGFGYVSDTFYPSLGISLAIVFKNRYGRQSKMIKYTNSFLLFTKKNLEGNTTVGSYNEGSLSYGWNFSKMSKIPRWVSLGIGFVNTKNNSTYFRGTTTRIFVSFDVADNFNLAPDLYLTNNLGDKIYGLRLSYTLP